MGHSSIMMTNDIYTTLDPSIKAADITAIYGNLYPSYTFENNIDLKTDLKNAGV
jgi:hypothetical protein